MRFWNGYCKKGMLRKLGHAAHRQQFGLGLGIKPVLQNYRTKNWKALSVALKARGSLLIWLELPMNWHSHASGKRGRGLTYSNEAIHFCLSIKCRFNLQLRQATGMTHSLLQLEDLDWTVTA